jgi:hypothetical protein
MVTRTYELAYDAPNVPSFQNACHRLLLYKCTVVDRFGLERAELVWGRLAYPSLEGRADQALVIGDVESRTSGMMIESALSQAIE